MFAIAIVGYVLAGYAAAMWDFITTEETATTDADLVFYLVVGAMWPVAFPALLAGRLRKARQRKIANNEQASPVSEMKRVEWR